MIRRIYSNYNLWDDYADDCREMLRDEKGIEDPADSRIWEEIYLEDEFTWDAEFKMLDDFFSGNHYLLMGSVGLWTGNHAAGTVFDDFEKVFYEAAEDCVYWELYDKDGEFHFRCSHHDGTNHFCIRKLTDAAWEEIDNWNYDWKDKRTEQEVHEKAWEMCEPLRYAERVYGVKYG